ncbi:MAG TPA: hypothetical protein VGN21_11020 [Stellaceae bacterium]|jgi:hypothetical protein
MSSKLKMLAIAAAMAAGTSGAAMAQVCPAGTAWNGATCAAAPGVVYAPSNPVSGAATGAAAGAATGAAAAGPVGAVVGGALGTATGTVAGTANMVTGAPVAAYGSSTPPAPVVAPAKTCGPGLMLYKDWCFAQ